MVILFTLWLILEWIFPLWLWIISGIFFFIHLIKVIKKINNSINGNNKKATFYSNAVILPIYLALALTYGTLPNGENIIQNGQGWTILFIFIFSSIVSGSAINITKNKKIKKHQVSASNKVKSKESKSENSKGKILHISINKKASKNVDFKISLNMARIVSRLIPSKAKDVMNKKGININNLIKEVHDDPEVGILAELGDGDEKIIISVEEKRKN